MTVDHIIILGSTRDQSVLGYSLTHAAPLIDFRSLKTNQKSTEEDPTSTLTTPGRLYHYFVSYFFVINQIDSMYHTYTPSHSFRNLYYVVLASYFAAARMWQLRAARGPCGGKWHPNYLFASECLNLNHFHKLVPPRHLSNRRSRRCGSNVEVQPYTTALSHTRVISAL